MSKAQAPSDPLAAAGGAKVEEKAYAGFLKLTEIGTFVVGKVAALKENKNGRYLEMVRHGDGAHFAFPVSSYLDNNYDVTDFVGEIVAIRYVSDMDTGEASPMRVYEVFTYGQTWPQVEGVEADADLPF